MPDFINGVKQAHLPEQAKLPGDETRFFKEGSSKSGDWMSELGNAAIGALEKAITGTVDFAIQGVKDIAKAPVDLAKGIGGGLASVAKGLMEGLKEASSTPQQQQPREKPAQQKDGQREAKSEPKLRPAPEAIKDFENRTQPQQNREQPQRPESGVKAHESKEPAKAEPTIRAAAESARDVAARSSAPSNAPQAGVKEVQAPTVRQNHAPALKDPTAPNQEKTWAAPSLKVDGEKVAEAMIKKSVDSVLKEIRASKKIPKEKTQEKSRVPDKSPERTR